MTKANDNKENSLCPQLEFVVLDIETTGLDSNNDEIIEIAALHFSGSRIIDTFSTFIKPKGKVPAFIKKLTHITDEMLADGISIKNALQKLTEFADSFPLVCHNARFDIEFINAKLFDCHLVPLHNKIYDTLTLSQIYIPDAHNHKLETMTDYFDISLLGAHRAINDAEATGWLMISLCDFVYNNIDVKTNYLLYEMASLSGDYADLDDILEKLVEAQKINALTHTQTSQYKLPDLTFVENQLAAEKDLPLLDIFGEKGTLAQVYDQYESRPGQLRMAEEIQAALQDNKHLLVEAGTGVGKSLAYLIPAVQFSHKNNSRVVISTNTKNLQEQIFSKDLPLLKQCLPLSFKAVLLKGRGNYICDKKWQETLKTWKRSASNWEIRDLMRLVVWQKFTRTGDIVENSSFNTSSMSSTWKKVVSDRHFCRGRRCSFHKSCHFIKKRLLAEEANIVVINHHLLLADAVTDNSVLGEYHHLIIDEAHNLPNTAHAELGFNLSWPDIHNFFIQLFQIRKEYQSGELINLKQNLQSSKLDPLNKSALITTIVTLINIIEESRDIIKPYFWEMGKVVKNCTRYGKLSYFQDLAEYKLTRLEHQPDFSFIKQTQDIIDCFAAIQQSVARISTYLKDIESGWLANYEQHCETIVRVEERLDTFQQQLKSFLKPDYDESAYWFSVINVNDDEYPAGVMNCVPLDISKHMAEHFYDKLDSIVFTSATLAIRGIFKYYERRMGINLADNEKIRLKIVDSPFDYHQQSLVLNTAYLPHYSDTFFFPQSLDLIKHACLSVPGGTMVLFTSYYDMDNAYKKLAEILPDNINLMIQSRTASRSSLLKQFKEDGKGLLLGTSSFWEGIDVPGEALSLIIIYKLPFPSPGDPFVEAYQKKLERENKRSFEYFSLPESLLKYRQGYGRLIRSRQDTGVIIVLDNRIGRKRERYGKYFIEVLPANTVFTRNPEETISRIGSWFLDYKLKRNR